MSRFARENPRKSNPHNRALRSEMGGGPRKPKRIDRNNGAGPPPGRSHPTPSRQSDLRRELPQHVRQDAAVAEIFELVQRVDAASQRHSQLFSVGAPDLSVQGLTRLEALAQAKDGDRLVAFEAKCLPARSFLEHQG